MTTKETTALEKDPFRLFFPIGWSLGLIGVIPWLIYALGYHDFYPRNFHINVMSRGFLTSFVFGFLMTSIPKFTESFPASSLEIFIGVILIFSSLMLDFVGFGVYSGALTILQILLLSVFIGRRFMIRQNNPPSTFIFVAIGLLLGFLGSLVDLLVSTQPVLLSNEVTQFGHLIGFYGMFLALIIGVGSRLFPGILGWVEIVQSQRRQYEGQASFMSVISKEIFVCILAFLFSFIVECFFQETFGRLLRACLVQYVAVKFWQINRLPRHKSWMSYALMASAWTVVFGEWINSALLGLAYDGKHIVFVGGFGLMSILVASRVTLAHGPGLIAEKSKWPYLFVVTLVICSALTRACVNLFPELYISHLGYAALLWVLALLAWGSFFLPKILGGVFHCPHNRDKKVS